MGINPPESFTRSDKDVCTSGLLPLVSVDASEEEIRHEICAIINNCTNPDLSETAPLDFEFINISGKRASIPHCKEGFEWNGRAVKELAGAGSIYVRLRRSLSTSNNSVDLVELPHYSVTTPSISHDAITNDGDDVSATPYKSVISNDIASTSYAYPILIDDDQILQECTSSADNPASRNEHQSTSTSSNQAHSDGRVY